MTKECSVLVQNEEELREVLIQSDSLDEYGTSGYLYPTNVVLRGGGDYFFAKCSLHYSTIDLWREAL